MRSFSKVFINGLFTSLPICISLYAVYWLANKAESILGTPLKGFLGIYPNGYYVYGLGMLIGILIVFLMGMLLEFYMGKLVLKWSERVVSSIPLVKTIYHSIKDLLDFVAKNKTPNSHMVVVELLPDTRLLGYVTRENWDSIKANIAIPGDVAVFFPFSYAMGGYTVMLPASKLNAVNMNFEEGYRFALTAYMISPTSERKE